MLVAVSVGAVFSMRTPEKSDNRLMVSASFYPLAEVARRVGGDNVTVQQIIPGTIEPHDFEPTAQQIQSIYSSDVFIYNGAGFDPWAERLENQKEAQEIKLIEAMQVIEPIRAEEHHEEDDHAGEESEPADDTHGHDSEFDPHFWLSPAQMQALTRVVLNEYIRIDPENKAVYQANAEELINQLAALDQEITQGLQTCELRKAIVSHNAFSYMEQAYGIEFIPIAGLSPEQEPSAQQLAEIADIARRENIEYIFYETLVSPKLAETLAQEVGAETLVLNPIEGVSEEETVAGADYFTIMKDNLTNLRQGLRCQ